MHQCHALSTYLDERFQGRKLAKGENLKALDSWVQQGSFPAENSLYLYYRLTSQQRAHKKEIVARRSLARTLACSATYSPLVHNRTLL